MSGPAQLLIVFPLFVPRHLDRLEFGFVRLGWVVVEVLEFHDPFVQVGESHLERIDIRELLIQRDAEI